MGTPGSFKKGFDPRRIKQKTQAEHYLWKGDEASYSSKHKWIVRYYGRASMCENATCPRTSTTFDWANISKKYHRVRQDYRQLCRKCHVNFDIKEIVAKRYGRGLQTEVDLIKKLLAN